MMGNKLKITEIRNRFGQENSITTEQLYNFYSEEEPTLNVGTFRWRIFHLKSQGFIRSLKRGLYAFEDSRKFEIVIQRPLAKLYNLIRRHFPYTGVSIWDTIWLHSFMVHQPAFSLIIIEVEKEAIHSVFEMLREKRTDVYMYSKKNDMDYILTGNSIIIKPFLTESPVIKNDKIVVPKIEKILVDLFFEQSLFITYQGQEMHNIFENIFAEYSINMTTLYRYARHRTIEEKLRKFLLNQLQIDKKYFKGD